MRNAILTAGFALLLGAAPAAAQVISGQVVDQTTGGVVPGVTIHLREADRTTSTDEEGRFSIGDLDPGRHTLETSHPGFRARVDTVLVRAAEEVSIRIALAAGAIELDPIEVVARSEIEQRRREIGTAGTMLIDQRQIEAYRGRGARDVSQALKMHNAAAVNVYPVNLGTRQITCIESTRAMARRVTARKRCMMVRVNIDGAWIPSASTADYLNALRLSEIEGIEFLPPSESAFRFGSGFRDGVILIATRGGNGSLLSTGGPARPTGPMDTLFSNRLGLGLDLGSFFDGFADEPNKPGPYGAIRFDYALNNRLRLIGDIGYSQIAGVGVLGTEADHYRLEHNWWFTMVGADWAVLPGRFSAWIGLRTGAGWRAVRETDKVGDPSVFLKSRTDFKPLAAVVPSFTLRYALPGGSELRLQLQDMLIDLFDSPTQNAAISLGVSYR